MGMGASGIGDGGEKKYNYKVVAWTNENEPCETKIVTTNKDPEFREVLHLPQDKQSTFLNLDLYSVNSTDSFFIGRANTALPMKINANEHRKIKLLNLTDKGRIANLGYLEVYLGLETGP